MSATQSSSSAQPRQYCIEIPVVGQDQNPIPGKSLIIEHRNGVLEVSFIDGDDFVPVSLGKVRGLPEQTQVPEESFFSSCLARVVGRGAMVALITDRAAAVNWPDTRLATIPPDMSALRSFYQAEDVVQYRQYNFGQGHQMLEKATRALKTGGVAVNICYLATSNLGYAAAFQGIKNRYRDLVTSLTTQFCELQGNNLLILQQYIHANELLPNGKESVQHIFTLLQKAFAYGKKNEDICQSLINETEELKQSVSEKSLEISQIQDSIKTSKIGIDKLSTELEKLVQEINETEEEIRKKIESSEDIKVKELRRNAAKYLTLGVARLFGMQTDFSLEQQELMSDLDHLRNKKQRQRDLEIKIDQELRKKSEDLDAAIALALKPGCENSSELVSKSIGLSLVGLDNIRSSLLQLQLFFRNTTTHIRTSYNAMDNAIQLEQQHVSSHQQIVNHFVLEFCTSGRAWLAMSALGQEMEEQLTAAHDDVLRTVELKEPDFSKHLSIAQSEVRMLSMDPGQAI